MCERYNCNSALTRRIITRLQCTLFCIITLRKVDGQCNTVKTGSVIIQEHKRKKYNMQKITLFCTDRRWIFFIALSTFPKKFYKVFVMFKKIFSPTFVHQWLGWCVYDLAALSTDSEVLQYFHYVCVARDGALLLDGLLDEWQHPTLKCLHELTQIRCILGWVSLRPVDPHEVKVCDAVSTKQHAK